MDVSEENVARQATLPNQEPPAAADEYAQLKPASRRIRRRRRSSVGETFGATCKAGFCHRADGKSNIRLTRNRQRPQTVEPPTEPPPPVLPRQTSNVSCPPDCATDFATTDFARRATLELSTIPGSPSVVASTPNEQYPLDAIPAEPLDAMPAEPQVQQKADIPPPIPPLASAPAVGWGAALAAGPRRRHTGHTLYPRQSFCVSMQPAITRVSTVPFRDHKARCWLEGRNHPDDKSAALNSNAQLRAKWKRELQQRQQKRADARATKELNEKVKRIKQMKDTAEKERLYLAHRADRAKQSQRQRRSRNIARQEFRDQCVYIEERAEQIAQRNCDAMLNSQKDERDAIRDKAMCRQRQFERQWQVQEASKKRNAAAYHKLYQVQSPPMSVSLRNLYSWSPLEENIQAHKRPAVVPPDQQFSIVRKAHWDEVDMFGTF